MRTKFLMLALVVAAGACSRQPDAAQNAAGNDAMINRADDAPGNAATAPVPMSGSGQTPPNAPMQGGGNQAEGGNQAGASQADNGSMAR